MQQSETQGIVIRLVPAIFAVVHDGNAIRAVSVRQICPILSVYFVSGQDVVSSLHAAYAQVVSGHLIIQIEGKLSLQQSVGRLPVHFVSKVNAVGQYTFIQMDVLAEKESS